MSHLEEAPISKLPGVQRHGTAKTIKVKPRGSGFEPQPHLRAAVTAGPSHFRCSGLRTHRLFLAPKRSSFSPSKRTGLTITVWIPPAPSFIVNH